MVRFGPYGCTHTVCPRRGPLVILNGVTTEGEGACVVVRGFTPFFYVVLPEAMQCMPEQRVHVLVKGLFLQLEQALLRRYEGERHHRPDGKLRGDVNPFTPHGMAAVSGADASKPAIIRRFELVERKLMDEYHPTPQRCVKVEVMLPAHITACKDLLGRPLGRGMSEDQMRFARGSKARDTPWMEPQLAAECHGLKTSEAELFCFSSGRQDITMLGGSGSRAPAKSDAEDPRQRTLDGFFGSKRTAKPASRRVQEHAPPSTTQGTWAFACSETNIDYGIRFMESRGISPSAWCTIGDGACLAADRLTNFAFEYEATPADILPSDESSALPLKVFSFDIETLPRQVSGSITQFYRGWDPGACLLTIGICISVAGAPESEWSTSVLQLDSGWNDRSAEMPPHEAYGPMRYRLLSPVEHNGMPVNFIGFESEEELFTAFVQTFVCSGAHVVTGWNIHSYDFPQLFEVAHRLTALGIKEWVNSARESGDFRCAKHPVVLELEDMAQKATCGSNGAPDGSPQQIFENIQRKLGDLRKKRKEFSRDLPTNYVRMLQDMDMRCKCWNARTSGVYLPPACVQPHPLQQRVNRFNAFGILSLDAYEFTKRDMKLRSYKLDFVADEILGLRKDDMPYSQIASAYESGFEGRLRIALYCAVDTALVTRLVESKKLSCLQKTMHLSMITGAFPADLGM